MVLRETGCEVVGWIHLAQVSVQWRADMNTVIEPSGSIKDGEYLDWLSDS